MNNFEKLQSMSVDELAKWLDEHLSFEDAPHILWFVEKYCDKCDSIEGQCDSDLGARKCEFAYCELEHKCRYFSSMEREPDNFETIKMWLKAEVEDEEII